MQWRVVDLIMKVRVLRAMNGYLVKSRKKSNLNLVSVQQMSTRGREQTVGSRKIFLVLGEKKSVNMLLSIRKMAKICLGAYCEKKWLPSPDSDGLQSDGLQSDGLKFIPRCLGCLMDDNHGEEG
jgi:hypothetical protein